MGRREALISWAWDAGERAVKTGAQVLGAAMVAGATFDAVNWDAQVSMVGFSMVLSVVTSVASAQIGTKGTASAVDGQVR